MVKDHHPKTHSKSAVEAVIVDFWGFKNRNISLFYGCSLDRTAAKHNAEPFAHIETVCTFCYGILVNFTRGMSPGWQVS